MKAMKFTRLKTRIQIMKLLLLFTFSNGLLV